MLFNHRKSLVPASIPPVERGGPRPFWSVMIPTYNCAHYLAATLGSVLDQAPDPSVMQIEVVDDCSTKDDPGGVVRELCGGRVDFYRQPRNVGIAANFNCCVRRAKGEWVHILHGDDLVLPGFYENYRRLMERYPDAPMVLGPSVLINEKDEPVGRNEPLAPAEGPVEDFLVLQAGTNSVLTPTVVVRRSVYESTGGFVESISHTTDWEMWSRAALKGTPVTLTTPLTQYRVHPGSDTNRLMLSGDNIRQGVETVAHLLEKLPPDLRRRLPATPYDQLARTALQTSKELGAKFHWKGAFLQGLWALRLKPNWTTLHWTGKALFHYTWQTVKPYARPRLSRSTQPVSR